jgi:hypothetical protein
VKLCLLVAQRPCRLRDVFEQRVLEDDGMEAVMTVEDVRPAARCVVPQDYGVAQKRFLPDLLGWGHACRRAGLQSLRVP